MKLSYILPIYRVEQSIAACLDSIYAQDVPEMDFEVICVDDCTPDASCEIIEKYQQQHSNLILLHHDINKKAGGARNTGLRAATGRYVWFVDSDDMIMPHISHTLLQRCMNDDLDVLCFNYIVIEGDVEKDECIFKSDIGVKNGVALLNEVFGCQIIHHLGYPVRCWYRRDVLLGNNIRFSEGMTFGEETTFMVEAICASMRVACVPTIAYRYVQNRTSSSAQLFCDLRGELIYQSCVLAGDMVVNLCNNVHNKSPELAANIEHGIPWFVNRLYIRLVKTNYRERKLFYMILKESNDESHAVFAYMDAKNRYIVKHPLLGMLWLNLLSGIYKFKHGINKV